MTDATLEYGVYQSPASPSGAVAAAPPYPPRVDMPAWISGAASRPGACLAWEEKQRDLPPVTGNRDLVRRVWEEVDAYAYNFIWNLLLCF
jgi:hypothetical protein